MRGYLVLRPIVNFDDYTSIWRFMIGDRVLVFLARQVLFWP